MLSLAELMIIRRMRCSMKFNHVTLIVTDLEHSKSFYRTLGLTQIVDAPPRYARFTFPEGAATLSIEVKELDSKSRGGVAELFFQCEAVDDVVRSLKAKGVAFDQDPMDMFYLWREARLRDPDGHELRFYSEATDVRLNPPWKIAAAAP